MFKFNQVDDLGLQLLKVSFTKLCSNFGEMYTYLFKDDCFLLLIKTETYKINLVQYETGDVRD